MKILITGCAGFIGYHLSSLLTQKKMKIYGIDNLNNYYDVELKKERLKILKKNKNFFFYKLSLENKKKLNENIKLNKYDIVINLAAQAGVRYSISNPDAYFSSNLTGFYNLLKICNESKVKFFVSASTSSVYGANKKFPLSEKDSTDNPLSFYAATKKCNEIIASSFNKIYGMKILMLRFFTVYGPYGRPDMSLYKFSESLKFNKNVELYNYGNHVRDFTYVDDVTDAIFKLIKNRKKLKSFEILNIAGSKPSTLRNYLNIIAKNFNKKPKIKMLPLQKGDVIKTYASNKLLKKRIKNIKITKLEKGIKNFVEWFKNY